MHYLCVCPEIAFDVDKQLRQQLTRRLHSNSIRLTVEQIERIIADNIGI